MFSQVLKPQSLQVVHSFKLYFGPCNPNARSVHADLLLSKAWTERAQHCMGQNTILNMFLFLKHFLGKNLNIHKISKQNNKKKNSVEIICMQKLYEIQNKLCENQIGYYC